MNTAERFAEFEKENGRSFIYGHIVAPYDGCFHLKVVAFVKDQYAYLTAHLKGMYSYEKFLKPLPMQHDTANMKYLRNGCVLLADIDEILTPEHSGGTCLDFWTMSELEEYLPWEHYNHALCMMEELEIGASGMLHCERCNADLATWPTDEKPARYFERNRRGLGGSATDLGAPMCPDCYNSLWCSYCGAENDAPWQNGVGGEDTDQCIWCADRKVCVKCGEEMDPYYLRTKALVEAWQNGICHNCVKERERNGNSAGVT